MKYHFLGGMDCPDWLLAQICSNFAKFTSLKFRILCQQAVSHSLDGKIDEIVLQKCINEENYLSDLYNTISILSTWIFEKSAGYECSADDLMNELVQLGLPPEHSKLLHKIYAANQDKLRLKVLTSLFKDPHAEVVSKSPTTINLKIGDKVLHINATQKQLESLTTDLEKSVKLLRK